MSTKQALRLFVAVELPEETRTALGVMSGHLQNALTTPLRWTKPEGTHLTLKFLGDVAQERVGELSDALEESVAGRSPFKLRLSSPGLFPDHGPPRVVWVGLIGDLTAMGALQQGVESALEPLGFTREKRGFTPHLTLARVSNHLGQLELEGLPEAVTQAEVPPGSFTVRGVSLMQSTLRPTGAAYQRLHTAALASD